MWYVYINIYLVSLVGYWIIATSMEWYCDKYGKTIPKVDPLMISAKREKTVGSSQTCTTYRSLQLTTTFFGGGEVRESIIRMHEGIVNPIRGYRYTQASGNWSNSIHSAKFWFRRIQCHEKGKWSVRQLHWLKYNDFEIYALDRTGILDYLREGFPWPPAI